MFGARHHHVELAADSGAEFIREYVLLHELMHRREMNHSRRFWRLVAACCPRHVEARQWLRKEGKLLWSGSRLVLAVAVLAYTAVADAQPGVFTGNITAHFGSAYGGDFREGAWTPGASMAVIDDNGVGVELDFAHAGDFDEVLFADSAVTSFMINVIAMYPAPGVPAVRQHRRRRHAHQRRGVQRDDPYRRTDTAFNVGAGMQFMFNEILGLRGDVRYFRYFQRHEDLPLLDDGIFNFWRTSFGVTLAWPIR